ncbi:hypothetical protein PsorP6_006510 [Peronosclerospora sorghi]|uniref:Uncharacterized protein n=1 Tax=Peronosclerospora sorghi TaxID=230839 RepID=A0ACC0W195_9STRA|nr:hypothetical protein PsorP6_006510 [Peronosclerospora sorghi]
MRTPHVLLYFDVNKVCRRFRCFLLHSTDTTVIMHDPVQGKTLPHIVNDLLTERSFGYLDSKSNWIWDGEKALCENRERRDGYISYGSYLRDTFPLSDDVEVAKKNKYMRKILRQHFTFEGNPGEGLATEYHTLLQHLRLPDTAASDAQLEAVGLHKSPFFFIVPAFFKLLQYLQQHDVSFNLIFRTFGDDLHRVAQEFNCFCEGNHPFFRLSKPMDGSDGSVDRRMHLDRITNGVVPRFGTFLRTKDMTALVMGTFKQPKAVDDGDPLTSYASQTESVHIVQELPEIHDFLARRWRASQATLALRDFYPYWFINREDATAGKLLTIDSTDAADNVHAMFFDDNILPHDAHIVDTRLVRNNCTVTFEETCELHLMRVEPLDVIQCHAYFINRFETSLQQWREMVRRD